MGKQEKFDILKETKLLLKEVESKQIEHILGVEAGSEVIYFTFTDKSVYKIHYKHKKKFAARLTGWYGNLNALLQKPIVQMEVRTLKEWGGTGVYYCIMTSTSRVTLRWWVDSPDISAQEIIFTKVKEPTIDNKSLLYEDYIEKGGLNKEPCVGGDLFQEIVDEIVNEDDELDRKLRFNNMKYLSTLTENQEREHGEIMNNNGVLDYRADEDRHETQEMLQEMLGKTLCRIEGLNPGSTEIVFNFTDGSAYKMYHWQDCCEDVSLLDYDGEMENLLHNPLLQAEVSTSRNMPPAESSAESYTWTFYTFGTIKGRVKLRWFGSSNGYYSEEVTIERIIESKEQE